MNISSIVINTKPEHLDSVISKVTSIPACEFHLHDGSGRIIVTIEAEKVEHEIKVLQDIQTIPQVIDAQMVFTYSEDELEKARIELKDADELPAWMNDPNAKMKDIKYGGDLKGRY